MIHTEVTLETDDDCDIPLQSRLRGSGAPAAYGSGDVLSAELWQPGLTAPLATGLAVAWNTADPATGAVQTGYDQGQTVTTLPASLLGTLQPSLTYILKVFRTLAGTSRRSRIAAARVKVKSPSAP